MGEIKLPGFSYTFSWQIDSCLSSLRSSKENSEIRSSASLAKSDCDCESSAEYAYPGIVSCDLRLLPRSESLTSGLVVDIKCADDLQRYEICFTYSIVNKEKECYVERSCPREAVRVRGCEARVEIDEFLNRNVLVKDLAVEPLDTIEILCEVSFLERSAISTMKRPSEVSPTDDSDDQQQHLTAISSPPASTTSLSSDLALLLNASRLSDVTLVTRDKRELKAHKAILGARSPVFASMFETDMLEQSENVVRIDDFEHEVLLEALRYIYAGTTDRLDELAGEILPVAEKYDVRPLKVDCEKLLEDRIDVDSCAKILVLADACNAERLKAAAESFIIERGGEVIKANQELQSLRSSHPHLLGDILFKLLENK